jgi:hypothetical protein
MSTGIRVKPLLPAVVTVFSLWIYPSGGEAQQITLGVLAGANLTDDFLSRPFRFGNATRYISDASEWFMVGPKVELGLPGNFSVEFDAIRRPIRYTELTVLDEPLQFPNGVMISSFGPFLTDAFTWQFSVFGKYRLSTIRHMTPFVEFGPSFLPIENRDQTGLTAGSGVELPVWRLRVAPTLRYTRWMNNINRGGASNQLQLVVGIHEASSSRRPQAFGRPLFLGVVAGFGVTQLLKETSDPAFEFVTTSDLHTPVVGVLVEAKVVNNLFIVLNGLYRPTHERDGDVLPDGSIRYGTRSAFITWEVPVLAKYKASIYRPIQPIFELGPSFRAIAHANSEDYAHYGLTGGAGISFRLAGWTISPTVRYTRWGANKTRLGGQPSPATRPDQLELVFGFSF